MRLKSRLRTIIKMQRKRGAYWVHLLDVCRSLSSGEGRARMWTLAVHGRDVHQPTPYTCEERYPDLFDFAASLSPDAKRILSFGCSTGEELTALRHRFTEAEIIGAEINPRSRRIATRRMAKDNGTAVLHPRSVQGYFDVILALAVLQREPHKIAEMSIEDLSPYYPFERFNSAVRDFGAALRPGGVLCIINAQYRVEDSSSAPLLEPILTSALMAGPLFRPDGRRFDGAVAYTIFRKRNSEVKNEQGKNK